MTKYETDDLCAIFMSGIDALRYLLNKAEDAPTTQVRTILNSFYIDDNHTTKVRDELSELWAARATIRLALQSALDARRALEPISFVKWEENGVRLKTRHNEFIVTTPPHVRAETVDFEDILEVFCDGFMRGCTRGVLSRPETRSRILNGLKRLDRYFSITRKTK